MKPPQKPTVRIILMSLLITFFSDNEKNKPIKKQPARLTNKVASGRREVKILLISSCEQYRANVPINPPIPIKKILVILFVDIDKL